MNVYGWFGFAFLGIFLRSVGPLLREVCARETPPLPCRGGGLPEPFGSPRRRIFKKKPDNTLFRTPLLVSPV